MPLDFRLTLLLMLMVLLWTVLYLPSARGCIHCKYSTWSRNGTENRTQRSKWRSANNNELLDYIAHVSSLQRCPNPGHFEGVDVRLQTTAFYTVKDKTELVARILGDYYPRDDEKMLRTFILELLRSNDLLYGTRISWTGNGTLWHPMYYAAALKSTANSVGYEFTEQRHSEITDMAWLREKTEGDRGGPLPLLMPVGRHRGPEKEGLVYGQWSKPYFKCSGRKWVVSYAAFVHTSLKVALRRRQIAKKIVGVVSADVDVTDMDINQCDSLWLADNRSVASKQILSFFRTHKCHNASSKCFFTPGGGWTLGSYQCVCRDGFYSATGSPVFNGTLVEAAWRERMSVHSPTYDLLYICKRCQEGCRVCVDDSPCLSQYNWAFRISLLTISLICVILTLVLAFYVYRYRKLKVIQVASPIFLCITLTGCAIMYSEMAAIFPVLDVYSCIATKWTRHMGFCITYSALLLKTWRVSLTYRVKSAHKLKLTDKQLLQWLFPILLVMAIYLGTWTISSPPQAVYILDWDDLKFKQCDFNWWDHSIAIGEFMFLLWGIRVCYNVRHAESFFNEARHISIAIYNITICNMVMIMIHLVILPGASPDIKYFFGFVRTQLSTTVTVILIFGPKFYRVLKGQGDMWDNRARARGVTASFSLNGVGLVHEEAPDLFQENEELKEEIQKLATQIEFMRIVHMEVNNRHLKPKHGGFFTNQGSIHRSVYMKFEGTDSAGSRVSPAAELVSERV